MKHGACDVDTVDVESKTGGTHAHRSIVTNGTNFKVCYYVASKMSTGKDVIVILPDN